MLEDINEIKQGSYIGEAILQNGTKIYLSFSNDDKLSSKIYCQFRDSIDTVIKLLKKIKSIEQKSDVIEKKQKLFSKYKSYFKDEKQFEIFFDYFYNDLKRIKQVLKLAADSSSTLDSIFLPCTSSRDFDSFTVAASIAPIVLDDTRCPKLFGDRNIFMAMTVTMKTEVFDAIAVNHYGIVRDPSSLLSLNAPTNNASMMLHSFAAYVSVKKYHKYLQVNNPVSVMRDIIHRSGITIYKNKEELLADIALPQSIKDYLEKIQDIYDLDYRKCGGSGQIAVKLVDLAKIYQDACILNQPKALLFAKELLGGEASQISASFGLESQTNVSKTPKKLLL